MSYKKKITADEFLELVINKELQIVGAPFDFKYLISDEGKQKHPNWFQEYSFTRLGEFLEWKEFFYEHFCDWKPKRTPKYIIEREFNWVNLNWGMNCDFPYEEVLKNK